MRAEITLHGRRQNRLIVGLVQLGHHVECRYPLGCLLGCAHLEVNRLVVLGVGDGERAVRLGLFVAKHVSLQLGSSGSDNNLQRSMVARHENKPCGHMKPGPHTSEAIKNCEIKDSSTKAQPDAHLLEVLEGHVSHGVLAALLLLGISNNDVLEVVTGLDMALARSSSLTVL